MKELSAYGTYTEFLAANPRPTVATAFFAMKNGEVEKFASRAEALRFSRIIEAVCDPESVAKLRAWETQVNRLRSEQQVLWKADLWKHFMAIDYSRFQRALDKAIDEADGDYDEAAEQMIEWYEIFSM
jgi:hypothetical protein